MNTVIVVSVIIIVVVALFTILVSAKLKKTTKKPNNFENLFTNEINANKQKESVECEECGATFDVLDGVGSCPYCGAKKIKK